MIIDIRLMIIMYQEPVSERYQLWHAPRDDSDHENKIGEHGTNIDWHVFVLLENRISLFLYMKYMTSPCTV